MPERIGAEMEERQKKTKGDSEETERNSEEQGTEEKKGWW